MSDNKTKLWRHILLPILLLIIVSGFMVYVYPEIVKPAAVSPPNLDSEVLIKRYLSKDSLPDNLRSNGDYIGEITDIYTTEYWHDEAIREVHEKGGIVLCYLDFSGININNDEYRESMGLRDSEGELVKFIEWPNNVAADPLSQDFRDYLTMKIEDRLDRGFDGIWIDNGMDPRIPDDYTLNTRPIDPRTDEEYTHYDYIRDKADLLDYAHVKFPEATFVCNGLFSGQRYFQVKDNVNYFDSYQYYMKNTEIDGIYSEGMFTSTTGDPWKKEDWILSLECVQDLQHRWLNESRHILVIGAYDKDIQSTIFRFTSTLLAIEETLGQTYLSSGYIMEEEIQELFSRDYGVPLESFSLSGEVYFRTFTKCAVFVNPSEETQVIEVPGSYRDNDGKPVPSLELPPISGAFLYPH